MTSVTIGNAQLFLGDMRDVLPAMGECCDLILTDPPYKLSSGGLSDSMGGCLSSDNYDNKGGLVDCDIEWKDFMPLLYNALRPGNHAYVMANNRHVQNLLNSGEESGFGFHNLLVWDKGTATPNRWGMKNCEFIGFFYKGKTKYWNDCGAKQLIFVPNEDYGDHPTVKPWTLMQNYIVQSTKIDEMVLDPFMGVGSTGLAAMHSGRSFIGVEKDEKWFDIAVKRLTNYYKMPKQSVLL